MGNWKNLVVFLLFPVLAVVTGENSSIKNSDTLKFCKVPENNFPKGSLKLFVFGDSYVDTGNIKPARFSDGCILTDFIASSFGIHSPVTYKDRDLIENKSELRYGMNFALSGSGVFKEEQDMRNMTFQINNFKDQINKKVYDKHDLENSIVLVSNAGNDYSRYVNASDSFKGIEDFTRKVVAQLIKNAKEIHQLGVKKVAIFGAPPTGCWSLHNARPRMYCNESWNEVSRFHNNVLQKAVQNLNEETMKDTFIYLELYNPIMSMINQKKGTPTYENPLIPCCDGVVENKHCGSFAEDGKPLFTKCKNPELSIFWDLAHLSNYGSYATYLNLISSLGKLY